MIKLELSVTTREAGLHINSISSCEASNFSRRKKRGTTRNASPRLRNRLSQLAYSGDAQNSAHKNTSDNINTIDDDGDYIHSSNTHARFRGISADKTISFSRTRGGRDMTEMAQQLRTAAAGGLKNNDRNEYVLETSLP